MTVKDIQPISIEESDRPTQIMVLLDDKSKTDLGLLAARDIAERFDAKVHMVSLIAPEGKKPLMVPNERGLEDLEQNQVSEMQKLQLRMGILPERAQGEALLISEDVNGGFAAVGTQLDIDLVILGVPDKKPIEAYFHRSLLDQVLQDAVVPVLAVGENWNWNIHKVMISTDLGQVIPHKIYRIARMFERGGVEIHLHNHLSTDLLTRENVTDKLKLLADAVALRDPILHVTDGGSELDGVIKTLEDVDPRLLLMKSYHKEGWWSLLEGSLAKEVVRSAKVPVFIEKVARKEGGRS